MPTVRLPIADSNRKADWVYRQTQTLVDPSKGCPPALVRRIATMVKTRNPVLTTQREATAQEIEDLEARQGRRASRPQYVDEPLAQIAGLEALYPEANLRQLLVLELDEKLRQFDENDIDAMSWEALRKWARWVGPVDATLDTAVAVIEHGRRLLTRENLRPFAQTLEDAKDAERFTKFLKAL